MSALSGVRVLDLSEGISGSIVGMFFADFGADVIKVEPPTGDRNRSNPGFAAWNRGKRSVTVDPDSEADQTWLAQSVLGADVCILDGGQVLSDWGDDVAHAAASNARLVLTKMPTYLPASTPWFGGKESAGLLSAWAGIGWRQSCDDGAPVELVHPYILYVHGAWAMACAMAALIERTRSGFGQSVSVTGINAIMLATNGHLGVDPNKPDPDTTTGGQGRHPTYRSVRAQDGWLASGALGPKFERAFLEAVGLEHILEDPRIAGNTQNLVSAENLGWTCDLISEVFAGKPRQHWIDALAARGIPVGPLLDRGEWLDHPQVVANGLRAEVDDPERGHVVMPGVPVTLTKTPGVVQRPAPTLGEHNGAAPWPAQAQPTGKPPITAGPLSHLRVVNMGTFVASPYAGFLFSELGADVIKVEPVTGDPFRATAFTYNRGMRSLAIDLQSDQGRELFYEVVKGIDIVSDGLRPGVTHKLGVDYEALRKIKPDIITSSLAAYGMHGDLASAPGVDMVLQAMSGLMLAQGSDENPVVNTIALIDLTTATLTVLGSLVALYHHAETAEGQFLWDSLMGTSTYLGLGEFTRFDGRPPAPRGAPNYKGFEPLDHYYPVSDGWIRVQALNPSEVTRETLKQAGIVVDEISVSAITSALSETSGTDAAAAFNAIGVPAVRTRRVSEMFHDQELLDNELVHFRTADNGGTIATAGRYATFSRTRRQGPLTPPGIGEHTKDILKRAGVPEEDIDHAVENKIVAQGTRNPIALAPIYR